MNIELIQTILQYSLSISLAIFIYFTIRVVYTKIEENRVKKLPEAIPFTYEKDIKVENSDEIYKTLVEFQKEVKENKAKGLI